MPRPKRNTDFLTGVPGIIIPIVAKFLKNEAVPDSLGSDERERLQTACFLAHAAAKPASLDEYEPRLGLIGLEEHMKRHFFCHAFMTEPDFALKLMSFVREKLEVGFGNNASQIETATAFLREGAMTRFRNEKGRVATDGELSQMMEKETGVPVDPEVFGDARRRAKEEDRTTQDLRRRLEMPGRPPKS